MTDEQLLAILQGATFGPDATLTLPSGAVLSSDEANWECNLPLRDSFTGSQVPQREPNPPAGGAEGLPPAGDPLGDEEAAWGVAHERAADAADQGEGL